MRSTLISLAALFAVLSPRPAAASYQANARARPLRVTSLPDGPLGGPAVRIAGVFALYDVDRMQQLAPRCGSVDFFCRGDAALCRKEWADFTAAAANGHCVALSLRLWVTADQAVEAPSATMHAANPYDPVMGVVTIPCRPEPPSAERPDLTVACEIAAAPPADAAATAPPPADAPVADVAATVQPASPPMASRAGCALGGGGGWPALVVTFLGLALRRRRG
jgi:hypothetical protein